MFLFDFLEEIIQVYRIDSNRLRKLDLVFRNAMEKLSRKLKAETKNIHLNFENCA